MKKILFATTLILSASAALSTPFTTCDYPIYGKNGEILYWNRDVRCAMPRQGAGEGRVMPESFSPAPHPPEEEMPPVEPPECNRECEELMEEGLKGV